MFSLRLTLNGQTFEVDPRRPSRIGSSPEADITVLGPSIAPFHAELRPSEQGWMIIDLNTPAGTYVDGQRVQQRGLTGTHEVYVGAQGYGAGFTAASIAPQQPPGVPDGYRQPPDTQGFAMTQAVEANPRRRGPATGPDIIVRIAGEDKRFPHPQLVTIGRHPDCTVRLTDPVVSRFHGRIDPVPGGWTYTNASNAGTFVKGRPVTTVRLQDSQRMRLGHPEAGIEVELIPVVSAAEASERIASRERRRKVRIGALIAAVLLVIAAGIGTTFAFMRGGGTDLSDEALDNAKLSTAFIFAQNASGDAWSGSGSVLTPDGLLLTNSHVGDPEGYFPLVGEMPISNPDFYLVGIHSSPDAAHFTYYRARLVDAQYRTDSALLQIYADQNGTPVGGLDLPTVSLGTSADLEAGQQLWTLGYPAIASPNPAALSRSVTVTEGSVSTLTHDLNRVPVIDTDARITHGNSGGLAIDADGTLIGVPTRVYTPQGETVGSNQVVEIDAIKAFVTPHL